MERPKWVKKAALTATILGMSWLLNESQKPILAYQADYQFYLPMVFNKVPFAPTPISSPTPTPTPEIIYTPRVIDRGNQERSEVALTFDCGPWVEGGYINSILDTLDQNNLKLTFFISGLFMEKYPDVFQRIISSGHDLAQHSYTHGDLTEKPVDIQRLEHRYTEASCILVTNATLRVN